MQLRDVRDLGGCDLRGQRRVSERERLLRRGGLGRPEQVRQHEPHDGQPPESRVRGDHTLAMRQHWLGANRTRSLWDTKQAVGSAQNVGGQVTLPTALVCTGTRLTSTDATSLKLDVRLSNPRR